MIRPWENVSDTNKICWPTSSGVVCHCAKALLMSLWCPWQKGDCLWAQFWLVCPAVRTMMWQPRGTWPFSLVWISRYRYQKFDTNPCFYFKVSFLLDLKEKKAVEKDDVYSGCRFGRTSLFIAVYKPDWISVCIGVGASF